MKTYTVRLITSDDKLMPCHYEATSRKRAEQSANAIASIYDMPIFDWYARDVNVNAVPPDEIMMRVRQNRTIVDALAGRNPDENAARELAGFLDVFHPDMDDNRKQDLVNERRNRNR